MGTAHAIVSNVGLPRLTLTIALALLSGCRSGEEPGSCPNEVPPAFSITVRADRGPLPSDTVLTLYYGGGVEIYELARPGMEHSVMFCDPDTTDHGAGGAGGAAGAAGAGGAAAHTTTQALTCELWVEGAATIWVSGGAYPDVSQELEGDASECGPETVEEELILGEVSTDSDAG